MIRTRFKKVLLIAPDFFQDQLLTDYKNVKHIATLSAIFPSLHQLNPDVVVFDYDYTGKDIENVIRRIRINKFYDKLKICCYKSTPNIKTDSLLKSLGVNTFFYREDPAKVQKNKEVLNNNFNALIDSSLMKLVSNVSH